MISFKDVIITEQEVERLEDGKLKGTFEIYPLPKGYGHTLGTSLRRTLLSSIPGYAITSVRVNDVDHEFTTISGVLENVLDIVLRLKKVRFKVTGNLDSYVITLNASGKVGEVKAGEFDTPPEVEIVNKDYTIATLTDKKAKLIIEATIEKGLGYKPPKENLREEVGRIPLDSIFSPVKLVNYEVLPVAKKGKVEYDKLQIVIETDGSVTPKQALDKALKTLQNLFNHLAAVSEALVTGKPVKEEVSEDEVKDQTKEQDQTDISVLGLSTRIVNNLRFNGINTVEELLAVHPDDLVKLKGIGAESAEKIKEALKKYQKK